MKIFFGPISGGFPLSSALAMVTLVAALPASAQDPPPAIVQPGAPGEPTRTLTPEEAAAVKGKTLRLTLVSDQGATDTMWIADTRPAG